MISAPGAELCVSSERKRPCASRADSSSRAIRSAVPMSPTGERKRAYFLVPCALRGKLALHEDQAADPEPCHLADVRRGPERPLRVPFAPALHPRHGEVRAERPGLELESGRPQSRAKPLGEGAQIARPVRDSQPEHV